MGATVLLSLPTRLWEHVNRLVTKSGVPSRLTPLLRESPEAPRLGFVRSPLVRRGTRLATAGLLVCIFVMLIGWQVVAAGLVETPSSAEDSTLESASWAFFAPAPPDSYSWYVVEAEYESGTSIDLVDGEAMDFDRPPNAMERYPTTLWKRYGTKSQGVEGVVQPAAAYVCRQTSDDVESVTIYRVEQPVDTNGPTDEPIPHQRAAATCG